MGVSSTRPQEGWDRGGRLGSGSFSGCGGPHPTPTAGTTDPGRLPLPGPHAQQVPVGPRVPPAPPHPPRFPSCKPCLGMAAAPSAQAAAGGSSLVSPLAPHWPPEGSSNLQSRPCPTSPLAQDKAFKAWAPLSSPESPDPWERRRTEPHWPLFGCGAWGGWANISVLGVLVRRSRLGRELAGMRGPGRPTCRSVS